MSYFSTRETHNPVYRKQFSESLKKKKKMADLCVNRFYFIKYLLDIKRECMGASKKNLGDQSLAADL